MMGMNDMMGRCMDAMGSMMWGHDGERGAVLGPAARVSDVACRLGRRRSFGVLGRQEAALNRASP
jgi:hypothetical protein